MKYVLRYRIYFGPYSVEGRYGEVDYELAARELYRMRLCDGRFNDYRDYWMEPA